MSSDAENIRLKRLKQWLLNECNKQPQLFTDSLLGVKLEPYQAKIFDSVWSYDKTAVKSCNGSGKSFTSGQIALAFCYTHRNAIVITTAPTARQVEKLIWKEIRSSFADASKIVKTLGVGLPQLWGDLMPKACELHLYGDKWCILGVSTNDPDKLVGFHSDYILVIIDEAAGVHPDIFSTIDDGILASGKKARMLMIGNPTNSDGVFYDTFRSPPPATNLMTISCFDTPNFTRYGLAFEDFAQDDDLWLIKMGLTEHEAKIYHDIKHPRYIEIKNRLDEANEPTTYLIKPQKVHAMLMKYGKDSRIFRARALGEFPLEGMDSLIPISWIERSNEMWKERLKVPA